MVHGTLEFSVQRPYGSTLTRTSEHNNNDMIEVDQQTNGSLYEKRSHRSSVRSISRQAAALRWSLPEVFLQILKTHRSHQGSSISACLIRLTHFLLGRGEGGGEQKKSSTKTNLHCRGRWTSEVFGRWLEKWFILSKIMVNQFSSHISSNSDVRRPRQCRFVFVQPFSFGYNLGITYWIPPWSRFSYFLWKKDRSTSISLNWGFPILRALIFTCGEQTHYLAKW